MDVTKKLTTKLLFFSLIIFPFGQIPGLIFNAYYPGLPTLHLFEVINMLLLIILIFKYKFETNFVDNKNYFAFIFIAIFSLLISLEFSFVSMFYLFRLILYVLLIIYLSKFLDNNKKYINILLNSLLIISAAVAIFGLIQYFWVPDLRSLKYLGWDNHYFRLTSTFLDPAFTGIILVLGGLLAIFTKKYKFLIILLPALALTYSRASYLSLLLAIPFLSFRTMIRNLYKYKIFAIILLFIFAGVTLSKSGAGVNLFRTHSIFAKLINYKETFEIIDQNPLFGVGYNNIRKGIDNSFLFVWATTGVVGLIIFINLILSIYKNINSKYKSLILSSGIAVLVHSQFTNTLFYAWVMYWFAILIAISHKSKFKT